MIDYLLDEVQDDFIAVQGIRANESANRAKMQAQCTYFRYYFDPYGYDKNGKAKYHTYRRREVVEFCKHHAADVLRPVFDWSGQQAIDYILSKGQELNPLYRMGYRRVGCWPCVMASQRDMLNISRQSLTESTKSQTSKDPSLLVFAPGKIPAHAISGNEKYPTIRDVVRYVQWQNATDSLFDDDTATSCMSYYGLCE